MSGLESQDSLTRGGYAEPTLNDLTESIAAAEADATALLTSTRVAHILKSVQLAQAAAAYGIDRYYNDVTELSAIKIYLTEIGYIPFPGHQEQIRLAQSIEAGSVAQDLIDGKDVVGEGNQARRTLRKSLTGRRLKLFDAIERGINADQKLPGGFPSEDVRQAMEARRKFFKGRQTKKLREEKALLRAADRGILAKRLWGRKNENANSKEARFTTLVHEGAQAASALSSGHLRLVVNIAKHFIGRRLSFGDLIGEGNIGLLAATQKFDWRLGFHFSTYATYWIRQAIQRALVDEKEIPVHFNEELIALDRRIELLGRELHRDPTELELTFSLLREEYPDWSGKLESLAVLITRMTKVGGGSEPSIRDIERTIRKDFLLELDSETFLRAFHSVRVGVWKLVRRRTFTERVSLDTADNEVDEGSLLDFLSDPTQDTPMLADSPLLRDEMQGALRHLTARERDVIVYRFGLGDEAKGWEHGEDHTLEEAGVEFTMTRERIRQIEVKAQRKLRHPSRSRPLRDYLTS